MQYLYKSHLTLAHYDTNSASPGAHSPSQFLPLVTVRPRGLTTGPRKTLTPFVRNSPPIPRPRCNDKFRFQLRTRSANPTPLIAYTRTHHHRRIGCIPGSHMKTRGPCRDEIRRPDPVPGILEAHARELEALDGVQKAHASRGGGRSRRQANLQRGKEDQWVVSTDFSFPKTKIPDEMEREERKRPRTLTRPGAPFRPTSCWQPSPVRAGAARPMPPFPRYLLRRQTLAAWLRLELPAQLIDENPQGTQEDVSKNRIDHTHERDRPAATARRNTCHP